MERRTETDSIRRWLAALLVGTALLLGPAVAADVPEILSYQGVLTLPSGSMARDGTYTLSFKILDDQDVVKYQETLDVELRSGLYSVLLGGQGGVPLSQVFGEAPRYMEVRVVSGAEPGILDADLPRQMVAPVPYALRAERAELPVGGDPVPAGAIILWDQPTGCDGTARTCPCGWSEAVEFGGMMVRGADTTQRWGEIPDDPGVSSGSPSAQGAYGDVLTAAEAPEHSHEATGVGDHSHSLPPYQGYGSGSNQVGNTTPRHYNRTSMNDVVTGEGGSHQHTTASSGGGGAHYHPSRRVLFCRKD